MLCIAQGIERIAEETRDLRERKARKKAQQESLALQHREKLKREFLKRQVAAKMAAKQQKAGVMGSTMQTN